MALEELHHIVSCSKCGQPKVISDAIDKGRRGRHGEMLIKLIHRCPAHGREKGTMVPLGLIEEGRHFVREQILRCKRCGGFTEIVDTKVDGRYVILKVRCPEHGKGKRKIAQPVFDIIMEEHPPHHPPEHPPHPHEPHPPPHDPHRPPGPRFCPSCGVEVPEPDSKYCHNCGAPL
ncbi:MAG: zinc-ribbon domain-containing protein [Promethearchaeota archaeon]